MNTLFGTKHHMTEAYVGQSRVAVTRIDLMPMTVAQVKSVGKDKYQAAQVVFGQAKKKVSKAMTGHLKNAKATGRFVREVSIDENTQVGDSIKPADVISAGSIVTVQGTSKGKGFAGGVKRWGFAGGPKTHGQSDRHRAPGSVGQGTTPGRVHRGKKMAGRMGSDTVTVKGVQCVAVSGNSVWVTGPVPGAAGTLIKLVVTGQADAPALTFLKGYEPTKDVDTTATTTTNEETENNISQEEESSKET